jgi:hypothetical protein
MTSQNDAGTGKDAPGLQGGANIHQGKFTGFGGYGDYCDEY